MTGRQLHHFVMWTVLGIGLTVCGLAPELATDVAVVMAAFASGSVLATVTAHSWDESVWRTGCSRRGHRVFPGSDICARCGARTARLP